MKNQATIVKFLDNQGEEHCLSFYACARFMEDRGNARGNSSDAISTRYRQKTERGWSNRQVIGLEDRDKIRRNTPARHVMCEDSLTVLTKFLRTRLVKESEIVVDK